MNSNGKSRFIVRSSLFAIGFITISTLNAAPLTTTSPLNNVRSFEYAIGCNTGTPGIYAAIAGSSADLIMLGGGSYDAPLNRSEADPSGAKLIFAYQDVAEAAAYMFPSLFAGGSVPAWFGNQNPGYPGLYTVQYWNPAWETALFANIDTIIANGYDGVFLDVLSGDSEWSAGNIEGNPVYPNAVSAMATLLSDIRNYISTKYPGKAFYLIGNNPTEIAIANPASLKNLDAIFNENVFYRQSATNGLVASYIGTANSTYIDSIIAPTYASAGIPIFGNDYPTPLSDLSACFLSFNFYSDLGWIPSVTTPSQTASIFSTGPFMFMATPSNSSIIGNSAFVNFISGGVTTSSTLIGGDQGDYFIGGPGQNTIKGGAGNDTIYAHPSNAAQKGELIFDFSSTQTGASTIPSVLISVNGTVVVPTTQITSIYGTSTQTFTLDLSKYPSISSVVITVTGTIYTDQNNFSNVDINDIIYNGAEINLANGTYTSGSGIPPYVPYSNNGTVTFSAASFSVTSPFLSNTSDTIDGGGGNNTVIYRGTYDDYTITQQLDGSWLVISATTAEGPDRLTNIQNLVFSDRQITLSASVPAQSATRLINISTRAQVGTGGNILIPGFVIGGSGTETLLIRADGPALTQFGVTGVLAQPSLEVTNSSGAIVASNTGWGTNSNAGQIASVAAAVGAFALPSGSADCAVIASLPPGAYTVQVSGVGNTTGVALAEVYEVGTTGSRLANISTRAQVGTGGNILIPGFVMGGSGTEQLLMRADGPSLTAFGVSSVLAQPSLTISNSSGTAIASNTGWGTNSNSAQIASTAASVGAFSLAPGSADSATIVNLAPGAYTMQVSGVNGTTGVALAEIYEVPSN